MPIRFFCEQCHQLLSIGSRKAGSDIHCPKCGSVQRVPRESASVRHTVAVGTHGGAAEETSVVAILNDLGMLESDDVAALGDGLHGLPANGGSPVQSPLLGSVRPASTLPETISDLRSPPVQRRPRPESLAGGLAMAAPPVSGAPGRLTWDSPSISELPAPPMAQPDEWFGGLSRRGWLVYTGALLGASIGTFFVGYFLGRRAERRARPNDASTKTTAREPVLLEGRVVFDTGLGQLGADSGAVVFVLPEGRLPEMTIPIEGLRPGDPPPSPGHAGARMIESLGGVFGQVDNGGAFRLVAPSRGEYRVLIVSNHVNRPPSSEIDEADLREVRCYFRWAEVLIGYRKYAWTKVRIDRNMGPIHQDFGRNATS